MAPLGSVPLDPNAEDWSEEIVNKHFEEDTGCKLGVVYVVQPGLSSRGGYFANVLTYGQQSVFPQSIKQRKWEVVLEVQQYKMVQCSRQVYIAK